MDLTWIGRSKVDHPLANARQARDLVSTLQPGDPATALRQITEWLASLNQTEGVKINRRFETVDLLDGAASTPQKKLSQNYLSTPRQQKYHENRLWNAAYGYWKELGDAYNVCIGEYESGSSGTTAIRRSLPLIVARTLRALTLQLKWGLLRYGPVERRIWSEISRLYLLAEQAGMADSAIAIYPDEHELTTPQREFLKALVLAASSPDGLLPMRLDIAERAVARFAGAFRLSIRPEGCTHSFDLAHSKPPVRLLKGPNPSETLRFFAAGEGLAELGRLTALISQSGVIPAEVNLGGSHDKEVVTGVLNHLAQTWSDRPPTRSAERRQTAGQITVVPGLNEMLGTFEPPLDDDLDFSCQASAEKWIVDNVSDYSYGAIIPARKGSWIRIGALIGVKNETSECWTIGIIRRIACDEYQQRRVGIQLLARTAIPIKIARIPETTSLNFTDHEPQQAAVLLTGYPDHQGEIGVVLRNGALNGCDGLEMAVREKSYLLRPTRIIEGGEDFDWATFKMTQPSA
jgi:hypothetical protein